MAGGKTLILTLAFATFRDLSDADFATAFQALLTSDQAEVAGWDAQKGTILGSGAFTGGLNAAQTVLTITYVAAGSYATTIAEIITLATLDSTVLQTESALVANDTTYNISTGS